MVLDEKRIEQEAKQILEKFANALKDVEDEKDMDSYVDRDEFEREEGVGSSKSKDSEDDSFKQKILGNAPESDDDFILVEKGSWK